MATIASTRVADLSDEQRKTIESPIGQQLRSDEHVHWTVFSPGKMPTAADKQRARTGLASLREQVRKNLDEQGASPEEFGDAVDEAVRHVRGQRAE